MMDKVMDQVKMDLQNILIIIVPSLMFAIVFWLAHKRITKQEPKKKREYKDCIRVFIEWKNGAYVSSLHPDFHKVVIEETEKQGEPVVIEVRDVSDFKTYEEIMKGNKAKK